MTAKVSGLKQRCEFHTQQVTTVHPFTCDFGLEGTATDVVRTPVFDADHVGSRSHGGVQHLVALGNLLAVHLHLGWTLDGHGQSAGGRLSVVDDEL